MAAQFQGLAHAANVQLSFGREPLRIDENRIALRRQFRRHLRQILAQDRNRLIFVAGLVKPTESGKITANIRFQLWPVIARPGAARRAGQSLIMAIDVDHALQNVEPIRLCHDLERREQHGGVMLLLLQRLPA